MLPVIGGFLLPVLAEIFEALDVIDTLVVRQNSDHLVVNFAAIIKSHDADDACLHDRTWDEGLGHVDNLDVERITVLVPGARDASVGKGISQG